MQDIERLAAESARLKAFLEKEGFKISYNPKTGAVAKITKQRKPPQKYVAVTWARKRGFKGSLSALKAITKNKKIGLRAYKNAVDRAESVNDARSYLYANGYNVDERFFKKVPNYVLKNNGFYENVRAILDSMAESEQRDITDEDITYSMQVSADRIRKLKNTFTDDKKKRKKKKPLKRR